MERSVEPIADAGIEPIARKEVMQALSKMKRGKAVGPDGIPAEVWKCLGEIGRDFLMSLFNNIVHSNTMPEEWRCSILFPIYKGKGDIQDCGNYRDIKLTSHTMKIWEKVMEKRLRKMVNLGEGREARLRWMGHVCRREDSYVGKRVKRLVIGRKKRGRPKRRWRDNIREDLRVIDIQEEDAMDQASWRKKIRTGDPT